MEGMDRRQFLLATAAASAADPAGAELSRRRATAAPDVLTFHDGPRAILAYRRTPVPAPEGVGPLFTRGAYIHPLHAPCGAIVTDDFPADHRHQRGVFFAWTKTQAGELHPDFWNLGSGTGRIRPRESWLTAGKGGPTGFHARHAWEMKQGSEWKPALEEVWEVTVHEPTFADPQQAGAAYIFDVTSRQTPVVDILLPEYRYGGMAVRGARPWHSDRARLRCATSEGKDLATADASRAKWVDLSGPVDGRVVGVALLEHPSTPGAPNMLRVPPDHPYAVFSPPKAGPMKLEAGKEYVFRYRLVVHNGPADARALNEEWKRFAQAR